MPSTSATLSPLLGSPVAQLIGEISDLRQETNRLVGSKRLTNQVRLEAALERIETAARQTVSEHAGMADELIGLYEQIGTVFEITRKLPHLQDEPQVTAMFRDTIANSFGHCEVVIARLQEPSAAPSVWQTDPSDSCFCVAQTDASASANDAVGAEAGGRVDPSRRIDPSRDREGAGSITPSKQNPLPYQRGSAPATCQPWITALLDHTVANKRTCVDAAPPEALEAPIVEALAAPVFCGEELVFVILVGRGGASDRFQASDMNLTEVLTAYCGDLIANFRLHHELRQISVDLVRSLVSTVDQKDPYTSGHSLRVGHYATLLGCAIGLDSDELQMLEWSALLHDVGKIGIRDEVLKKTGRLTDEEFEHIKEHPIRSFEVVRRVPQLAGALDGILYHHEHYDGSGYPKGLVGKAIPSQARIVQVADVFDALTSSRAYRKAFSWTKALEILDAEAGKTIDPALTKIFSDLVRRRCESHPQAWESLVREAQATLSGEPKWQRLLKEATSSSSSSQSDKPPSPRAGGKTREEGGHAS